MKHLLLTGDETPDDIRAAITHLRIEQTRQVIESTRNEYGSDVDELLDLLVTMTAPIAPVD